ncbi:MAG TPA: murein L,D-transpeptidase [Sulfurovum sp.]|nr:murein L,D-transpeptidase [Sulfurovum sp.]
MFKTLVILFIVAIVAVLLYNAVTGVESKKTTTNKIKKAKAEKKKTITPETKKEVVETDNQTEWIPPIITDILEKYSKPKATQASLAENIEQIGGKIGDAVFVRIFKKEAELEVWMRSGTNGNDQFSLIQTYPICAYSGDLGPKLREGDGQSPEGFYYVKKRQLNPNSNFHLAFNIGYPNRYDRAHKRTGSFIMVHGSCASIGCYAMTDNKIEEIYELVEEALTQGQGFVRVHIFPFRMSDEAMIEYQTGKWYSFWKNLQEGYRLFEESKIPPNVNVRGKSYIFGS